MIFQHTIDKVLSGEKTQTRRIVKPSNEVPVHAEDGVTIVAVGKMSRPECDWWITPMWHVDQDYAAQPGRGKPAVARIRITDIRREDVRAISYEDVKAEGFNEDHFGAADLENKMLFLATWTSMHDKPMAFRYIEEDRMSMDYDPTYEYINQPKHYTDTLVLLYDLRDRPAARYDAWALTFELVTS